MDIKKRLLRTLLLAFIGLIIGGGLAYYQIQNDRPNAPFNTSRDAGPAPEMPGVKVGGDFTLTDHHGEPASVSEWNQHKLIYFGFTYCPAICPTELQKISAVLNRLQDAQAVNIQPLFITVDPERDTVAVMKDYISLFHPAFVGMTGSPAEIDSVKKQYKVFSTKVDDPQMSEYTIDHSSYIYLMSPENTLISMYRMEDDVEYILGDMRAKGVI